MSDAFWQWWETARDRLDAAIGDRSVPDDLVAELSEQVEAIPPGGLAWELTPGESAAHALVVTAGGDPELRAAAERWRRSAPPADARWESVDVLVHHPAFAGAPDELRNQVTYLALDWLLGEEDVERFVGAIEPVAERPDGARPLRELREVVAELDADAGDWVILEGRPQGGSPVMVSAMARLKPVDHPLLDTHAKVTAPYETEHPDGYPDGDELDRLRALEEGLGEVLGEDGAVVAHASSDGTRVLHAYLDGESGARERLGRWAAEQGLQVEVDRDPAWDAVRRYR